MGHLLVLVKGARVGTVLVRVLLLAALTMFLSAVLTSPALAHTSHTLHPQRLLHAILQRTDPLEGSVLSRPPTSVCLWFSEPVQLVGPSVTVLALSGINVEQGAVRVQGAVLCVPIHITAEGSYLVTWDVISQDTHPASGAFVFSIGHIGGIWASTTTSSVSPLGLLLQILARLLHFLGYALGFGSLAFCLLVLRPLAIDRKKSVQQRTFRLVTWGIILLLLAEPVALLAQIVSLRAGVLLNAIIIGDVLASSFGHILALRLGAGVLLWVIIGIAQQGDDRAIPATLVVGLLLAVVDGEASHAVSSHLVWLGLIANTLHIAAMGIWIGGLVSILYLWRLEEIYEQHREMLLLFGQVAVAAVVELVLSGSIMAWLQLSSPADFFTSAYGEVLTIKILALSLPLLFAFISQRTQQRTRWWVPELLALISLLVLACLLASLPQPT
ncbi:MAG TPA: copper resistance protein CopC [Ktedonobacteraceae bacterium]|nr:copper resistance protein CopC [Ktedonobacteraceae bacterium]